jgi:hypothetical protein
VRQICLRYDVCYRAGLLHLCSKSYGFERGRPLSRGIYSMNSFSSLRSSLCLDAASLRIICVTFNAQISWAHQLTMNTGPILRRLVIYGKQLPTIYMYILKIRGFPLLFIITSRHFIQEHNSSMFTGSSYSLLLRSIWQNQLLSLHGDAWVQGICTSKIVSTRAVMVAVR